LIYSLGFSQEIELSENQLKDYLCKSWRIDHVLINGQEVSGIEYFQNMEFHFNSDNTYTIKGKTENVPGRNWKYNKTDKCVEIFSNSEIIERIKYVDFEKLVITPILDEQAKIGMKTVELYLKPFN
jgi:hypothetical protein